MIWKYNMKNKENLAQIKYLFKKSGLDKRAS